MGFEDLPLIDAATTDNRLRPIDVCVLVRSLRMLSTTEDLPIQLDAVARDLPTSRGDKNKVSRSSVRRSLARLSRAGYILKGRRVGVGGTLTWRKPGAPAAVQAKLRTRATD